MSLGSRSCLCPLWIRERNWTPGHCASWRPQPSGMPHLSTREAGREELLSTCFHGKLSWEWTNHHQEVKCIHHLDLQPKTANFSFPNTLPWNKLTNKAQRLLVQIVQFEPGFLSPFFRQTPNKMQVKQMKHNQLTWRLTLTLQNLKIYVLMWIYLK